MLPAGGLLEDLRELTVPVLVMHVDGDRIVPYADSSPRAVGLFENGRPVFTDGTVDGL